MIGFLHKGEVIFCVVIRQFGHCKMVLRYKSFRSLVNITAYSCNKIHLKSDVVFERHCYFYKKPFRERLVIKRCLHSVFGGGSFCFLRA